jgi:uncharacterized repeat protein (TIGR03843 family)
VPEAELNPVDSTDDHVVPSAVEVLTHGAIELVGRLPFSSNAAFLVQVTADDSTVAAVYKPARGERPLHDFPPGLYRREVATYLLAQSMGWDLVPPTVLRTDAPVGEGSLQLFVEHDPEDHYFELCDDPAFADQFLRVAVFDLVANSADRKGGHLLRDVHDHIWAIDNGLTLHAQFKLRTVVWDFAGQEIPADLLAPLEPLAAGELAPELAELLDSFERDAVAARARAVLHSGVLPHDPSGQRWPWPPV